MLPQGKQHLKYTAVMIPKKSKRVMYEQKRGEKASFHR